MRFAWTSAWASGVIALPLLLAACSASSGAAPAEAEKDPQRCATCHLDEYRATTHPVHVGEKPTTCAICHTQDSWHPDVLSHPWPLDGAHAKTACFKCHTGDPPKFEGTAKACYGCHKSEYQKAPNHVARKFPTTCDGCHLATTWKDRIGSPLEPLPPAVLPAVPGVNSARPSPGKSGGR
jgi:hypothetical protein